VLTLPWQNGARLQCSEPILGLPLDLPASAIAGKMDGPTLMVTAGVYGGEDAGIEAAIRLARTVGLERLRGRLLDQAAWPS
jgi:predicted deacylase